MMGQILLIIIIVGLAAERLSAHNLINNIKRKYISMYLLLPIPLWVYIILSKNEYMFSFLIYLTAASYDFYTNFYRRSRFDKKYHKQQKVLEESLNNSLSFMKKMAGLNNGQGLISHQPFMEEYNQLNINDDMMVNIKTKALDELTDTKKKVLKSTIENIILDKNLKSNTMIRTLSELQKRWYNMGYKKVKENQKTITKLYYIIHWSKEQLNVIDTSKTPRNLIKQEFENQIEECISVIENLCNCFTLRLSDIKYAEYVLLNMSVRIHKFKTNSEKFDEEEKTSNFSEEVNQLISDSIISFSSDKYADSKYNYIDVSKNDIEKSKKVILALFDKINSGEIKLKSSIYKPFETMKISVLGSDSERKGIANNLLNYYLLAREYNRLMLIEFDELEMSNKQYKTIEQLKDNMCSITQYICGYGKIEFPESHFYNKIFISTISGNTKYTINQLSDMLFKTIAVQQKISEDIGFKI